MATLPIDLTLRNVIGHIFTLAKDLFLNISHRRQEGNTLRQSGTQIILVQPKQRSYSCLKTAPTRRKICCLIGGNGRMLSTLSYFHQIRLSNLKILFAARSTVRTLQMLRCATTICYIISKFSFVKKMSL